MSAAGGRADIKHSPLEVSFWPICDIGHFSCCVSEVGFKPLSMCPAKPLRCRLLSLGGRHEATRVHHASRRCAGVAAGRACATTGRTGLQERLPALAAELVRLDVDVIVASGANPANLAAMKATTTIPIVMTSSVDPVSAGLVASLARPGGNVTGLTADAGGEILGKRFELLKETLPNLSRLGILFNPDVAFVQSRQTSMGAPARRLGLTLVPVEARGLDALEQAFATMVRERAQA